MMNLSYVVNNDKFYPNGDIITEDQFDDGLNGWTWLMDHHSPISPPVWSSRRAFRGKGSMLLETGNVLRMHASGAGTATAIKRLTLPKNEDGSYVPIIESEYWFGYNSASGDRPSFIQFGLDTQRADVKTHRLYYKIRYEIYDEEKGEKAGIFKIGTPNGFINVMGEDKYTYWNEAKAGFFNVRFTVNIVTGKYDALWVNGKKYDISNYECVKDGYVGGENGNSGYDEGMNYSVDLFNRLNTTGEQQCKLYIGYVKGSVVR